MQGWDDETTATSEQVPLWLIEFSQIWAADSAVRYPQEFAEWRRLAEKDQVPPFVIVLRLFRDTYGMTVETTREAFKIQLAKQMEKTGGQVLLHYKGGQS